jgi:hypothetical protein
VRNPPSTGWRATRVPSSETSPGCSPGLPWLRNDSDIKKYSPLSPNARGALRKAGTNRKRAAVPSAAHSGQERAGFSGCEPG